MAFRILRVELRRSAALLSGLIVAAVGVLLLFTSNPPYLAWMEMVYTQRDLMRLTWPLAVAAGAWQGMRERRLRVEELLATTPRPRRQRVLPVAGAMAIAAAAAYVVMFAAGVGHLRNPAGYFPFNAIPIAAIGALGMVAAVWLGLAIGSLLPSPVTPPVIAVVGFTALGLLPEVFDTNPTPGAFLLMPQLQGPERASTAADQVPYLFQFVSAPANLAQAVWLGAVAFAGLALFGAARSRTRVTAVVPVLVGAAIALPILPATADAAWLVDRRAAETVCTLDKPKVCTLLAYSYALDQLRGPGREALSILAAKLPSPPTRVLVRDETENRPGVEQPADTLLVFVSLYYDDPTRYKPGYLLQRMTDGAGVRACATPDVPADSQSPDVSAKVDRNLAARLAVGAWLQDQDVPTARGAKDPILAPARAALAVLRALPTEVQQARVSAYRDAERACSDVDRLGLLTGGER
jgi:hypothetical protein